MDKSPGIGFIGYGNMAQAMAAGLIGSGACDRNRISACAGHYDELCKKAEKLGIRAMMSAEEVVANSDFVIFAVKPYQLEAAIAPVLESLRRKAVISVVAGYDFDRYEKLLKAQTRHISTIPNIPISTGEGILVCENRHSLTDEEYEAFARIFGRIALIESVDTAQLSAAGTISGCTPAFTAMYLEALADAGVKYGLPRETACRMAAKMLCGTGKLYMANGGHPGAIKDAVCSPGGTTIRGVAALEKRGFRGAVIAAVDAIESE